MKKRARVRKHKVKGDSMQLATIIAYGFLIVISFVFLISVVILLIYHIMGIPYLSLF